MANLTPMIDVVFQLIIFFMLAAQFSSQQTIKFDLPSIDDVDALVFDSEGRAVINLVPEARVAEFGGVYRLGTRSYAGTPEGVGALADALSALKERDPNLRIVLRAARTEAYERVHPALQALTLARLGGADLAVLKGDPGGGQP